MLATSGMEAFHSAQAGCLYVQWWNEDIRTSKLFVQGIQRTSLVSVCLHGSAIAGLTGLVGENCFLCRIRNTLQSVKLIGNSMPLEGILKELRLYGQEFLVVGWSLPLQMAQESNEN